MIESIIESCENQENNEAVACRFRTCLCRADHHCFHWYVFFFFWQLVLKHRQGKNHKMRIIVFVGSPVEADEKDVSCLDVMRNTVLLLVLIYSVYSCTLDCPQMNTYLMQNFTVAFCQIMFFNFTPREVHCLSKTCQISQVKITVVTICPSLS